MKMTEKNKTLSKERVKNFIIHKVDRGRWIKFTDIKGLGLAYVNEFKDIIKEMIDEHDYDDQQIWIEFSEDYESFKIFNNDGFKKLNNEKNQITIR